VNSWQWSAGSYEFSITRLLWFKFAHWRLWTA